MKLDHLSVKQIESRSNTLLDSYFTFAGSAPSLPIPVDRIVELYLDIPMVWKTIPSNDDRVIVSKIISPSLSRSCQIVINEDLRSTLFLEYPGLERTALAHEAGHHQLHINHAHRQQLELGLLPQDSLETQATYSKILIEGIDENTSKQVLQMRGLAGDDWWREWQAHTFMRFLLMPQSLLEPLLMEQSYLSWSKVDGLYDLRDRLGVTISSLVIHLSKLGYIRIDPNRNILDLSPLARGQRSLGL